MTREKTPQGQETSSMPISKPLDSTSSEPLMKVDIQIFGSQNEILKSADLLLTYSDSLTDQIELALYQLILRHSDVFPYASVSHTPHMKRLVYRFSISYQLSTTKESPPKSWPTSGKT
jgi:hypothetical protein